VITKSKYCNWCKYFKPGNNNRSTRCLKIEEIESKLFGYTKSISWRLDMDFDGKEESILYKRPSYCPFFFTKQLLIEKYSKLKNM